MAPENKCGRCGRELGTFALTPCICESHRRIFGLICGGCLSDMHGPVAEEVWGAYKFRALGALDYCAASGAFVYVDIDDNSLAMCYNCGQKHPVIRNKKGVPCYAAHDVHHPVDEEVNNAMRAMAEHVNNLSIRFKLGI